MNWKNKASSTRHQLLCGIPARKDESITLPIEEWKAILYITRKWKNGSSWTTQFIYTLQTTQVTDQLGISSIAKCTAEDPILCKILGIIKSGKTYMVPISNSRFVIHNSFSTFHKSLFLKN